MQRDQDLQNIRPAIETAGTAVSEAEVFQNRTLRPILKLQNDLLLATFQHYAVKRKGKFFKLPEKMQLDYIEHSVRTDLKFKNRLVGMIVGHFTLEEWEQYLTQESEFTRRITEMIVQRLQSQLSFLQTTAA